MQDFVHQPYLGNRSPRDGLVASRLSGVLLQRLAQAAVSVLLVGFHTNQCAMCMRTCDHNLYCVLNESDKHRKLPKQQF